MEEQQSENNDTFLSRVFGVHSVYNQLQDDYQYYDPENEEDSRYNEDEGEEADKGKGGGKGRSASLLASESDLELSLLSSQDTTTLPYAGQTSNQQEGQSGQVRWDTNKSRYGKPEEDSMSMIDEFEEAGDNEQDGSILPLYQKPHAPNQQEFRKQAPQGPTMQTMFQRNRDSTKARKRFVIPPKERALYLWANITNMDQYLTDVYYYYRGKGLLNIVLSRIVDLIILAFILLCTVFFKWGINDQFFVHGWKPPPGKENEPVTLRNLIIPHFLSTHVPFPVKVLLFGFISYIGLRLVQLFYDYNYKLREIKNFYHHLLGITDDDELMTIPWYVIVERIMALKDYNSLTSTNYTGQQRFIKDVNSKVRLDAHDIANRIMRKENYFIALINKDVLDLSLSLPLLGSLNYFLTTKAVLTRTLEWNIKLCINNFVFTPQGQLKPDIMKEFNRNQLANELSARFKMAAIINLILCPFIVIYFVLLYFFRYFNEYKTNPGSLLGLRQYTPWAEWKLREFNELPHLFIRRLHLSTGPANTYINQFPRGFLVVNFMVLINFVSGALTAVLVLMGLWYDNEEHSFWSFEITKNKTTLFYISFLGTIWAITSNSLATTNNSGSTENAKTHSSTFLYDPQASLRYVAQFTHYLPSAWNGRLHTTQVRNEFCELYSLKIILILNEILSLILTPFILWFKVLNNSGAIIDFFREFSVYVDGLGYICYFSMFNFEEKDKNMMKDFNNKKRKQRKTKRRLNRHNSVDPQNIELDDIKQHKDKKASGSESESSSSETEDLYDNYYHDDKMIKSYMYFLETCGGPSYKKEAPKPQLLENGPSGRAPANNKSTAAQSMMDPPSSLLYQHDPTEALNTSSYTMNYNMNTNEDEDQEAHAGTKSGVLGMINQFYKHDR